MVVIFFLKEDPNLAVLRVLEPAVFICSTVEEFGLGNLLRCQLGFVLAINDPKKVRKWLYFAHKPNVLSYKYTKTRLKLFQQKARSKYSKWPKIAKIPLKTQN